MAENKNALPLGTILNARYEIESLIGGGSFGLVYQARHTHLNTVVAIKELFPRDIVVRLGKAMHPVSEADAAIYHKVLNSFRKEGRNLASLSRCPSVVQCSDYFEENGTGYCQPKVQMSPLNQSSNVTLDDDTTLNRLAL